MKRALILWIAIIGLALTSIAAWRQRAAIIDALQTPLRDQK